MQYLDHHIDAFLSVFREGFEDFATWSNTIFRGMELPIFCSLIGNLVVAHDIAPDAVRTAIPEKLAELPWQGCELTLMSSLAAVLTQPRPQRRQDRRHRSCDRLLCRGSSGTPEWPACRPIRTIAHARRSIWCRVGRIHRIGPHAGAPALATTDPRHGTSPTSTHSLTWAATPANAIPIGSAPFDERNGVYVIREHDSGTIAYVGESHSARLYGTLTRHFQRWSPKFDTAGPTYDRGDVEVAVVTVPKTHAMHLQNDLICALESKRTTASICGEIYETEGLDPGSDDDQVVELPPARLRLRHLADHRGFVPWLRSRSRTRRCAFLKRARELARNERIPGRTLCPVPI